MTIGSVHEIIFKSKSDFKNISKIVNEAMVGRMEVRLTAQLLSGTNIFVNKASLKKRARNE